MYDPIVKIYEYAASQFNMHIENEVFSIIKRYNIDVDKDELIRALAYDRKQYEMGYSDGVRDFYTKLIARLTTVGSFVFFGEQKFAHIYQILQEELDEILSELGMGVGGDSE